MPRLSMPAATTRVAALLIMCAAVHVAGAAVAACPLRSDDSAMVPWCDTADRGDAMLQMGSKTIKMEKRSEPWHEDEAKWKVRMEGLPAGLFTQEAWETAVDAAFGLEARMVDWENKPILANKYKEECCENTDTDEEQHQLATHSTVAAAEDTDTDEDTHELVNAEEMDCHFMDKNHVKTTEKCKLGDPAIRAMSMENIQKVETFLKTLASGGYLKVPNYEGKVELKKVTEVNMHNVNAILVKPLTFYSKLSFVAHIGGGKPDYFVSHSWGGSFLRFATSIKAHFEELGAPWDPSKTFYWVCTFANNQHKGYIEKEMGDSKEVTSAPFYRGIQIVQQVVSIQDEEQPDQFTLTRAWCMFEMLVALEFKKPIVFMCNKNGFSEQGPLSRDDNTKFGCTPELLRRVFNWNPADAKASKKDELKNIKDYITKKGCEFADGFEVHQVGVGKVRRILEKDKHYAENGMECLAKKMEQIAEAGKSFERRNNIFGGQTEHVVDGGKTVSTNELTKGRKAAGGDPLDEGMKLQKGPLRQGLRRMRVCVQDACKKK